MSIGAFSVSLTVKDIKASKAFYEKLGFNSTSAVRSGQTALICQDDDCARTVSRQFDKNMLTLQSRVEQQRRRINPFKDVRTLQEELREKGIETFLRQLIQPRRAPAVSSLRIRTAIPA